METEIITIADREPVEETLLRKAARILREGGLVAFPTETVYGLGGNALDPDAARRIYAAKGRPSDNPLIVHIARFEELYPLSEAVPDAARHLAEAFWPGPLTMIFRKSQAVPDATSGGLPTVAVRMPSDPVARALIRLAGVPVAAPSANLSGRPSPTRAEHVIRDLSGKIPVIIDGGSTEVGLESTIVDLTGEQPVLLRPGAVTVSMLEAVLGPVELDPVLRSPLKAGERPKAPGMKYRHYAPKAELLLVDADAEETAAETAARIGDLVREAIRAGRCPGILATEETKELYREGVVMSVGNREDTAAAARNLFAVLRAFDESDVDVIYAEVFPEEGMGLAVMNRMNKAAGHRHIKADGAPDHGEKRSGPAG